MREGMSDPGPLLDVEGLTKVYETNDARLRTRSTRAVDDVSFSLDRGETFAIVGESGSGKSTVGRVLLGLYPPTSGRALLDGEDILALDGAAFRPVRRRIQMVFQDPLASFDPRASIRRSLRPSAQLGGCAGAAAQDEEIDRVAEAVGLDAELLDRLPAKVSGGQLQRLSVARALLVRPDVIFLDEPTSALDVSIRGQVVNLLLDLQRREGIAYLLVAHDLRVVYSMAHRVAVMYLGQIVEVASRERLYEDPRHPYTRGLLDAANLDLSSGGREVVRLSGELSEEDAHAEGCRLVRRCPFAESRCGLPQPLVEVAPGHHARCWKSIEDPMSMGLRQPLAAEAAQIERPTPGVPAERPDEELP